MVNQKQHFDRQDTLDLIQLSRLPTLPDRFMRIQQAINNPASSSAELAGIIQTDQSTTAMILKVANSAHANPIGKPVGTLQQAITRLGEKEVGHIAMTMALVTGYSLPMGIQNVRDFWAHSYATGAIAEKLARHIDPAGSQLNTGDAFMCGLLLDIGRVMIGLCVDLSYFETADMLGHGDACVRAETERYGIDHAEVGAIMLKQWHFPGHIVRAVGEHHGEASDDPLVRLCQIADKASHEQVPHDLCIDEVPRILNETLPRLMQEYVSAFRAQPAEG